MAIEITELIFEPDELRSDPPASGKGVSNKTYVDDFECVTWKVGSVNNCWELSSFNFSKSFSVSSQDNLPAGLFFKPDGLKMYVNGVQNNYIYEYDLSTAWDVSTSVFLQSFSIAAQNADVRELFFRSDGLKLYTVGIQIGSIYEYDLTIAWDISTLVFLQSFSVSSQDNLPHGLFFKPDGLKMYVNGVQNNYIYEYDLSTAWDVSTSVFLQSFSVGGEDSIPVGIFFKPDGLILIMIGYTTKQIYEYDITKAWDITTVVLSQTMSISAQDNEPHGLFVREDGKRLYFDGLQNDNVYQYDKLIPILTADEKSDYDLVVTESVRKADIVDNLTSTDTDKPLSANQGRELQARTVEGGFFFSNAVQNLVPNVQQTISWAATAFMGKQNPVNNMVSSTTLSLTTPGKYEVTVNVVVLDKNATSISSVINLEVDSNITSTILYRDSLRTNEAFTVGATTSHYSSFLLDVQSPTDSHILRCKLTLLAASGSYDVLTSTYFKAVKYG